MLSQKTKSTIANSYPDYFYSLDVIRGLAALSVVLWHWQHFYYNNTVFPASFNRAQQPYYSLFYLFYENGLLAVDFFFVLSGFIFFCLYGNRISKGSISFKDFSVLRLSRLYPLHFLTLLFVIVLQLISYYSFHNFFVYPYNNLYHLFLNIFFTQSWGLEKGESFNGPTWSVSVEIFLYLLFFVVCRTQLIKKKYLVVFVLIGMLVQPYYSPLGRGIFSFFIGGIVFFIYSAVRQNGNIAFIIKTLIISSIVLWLVVILESKYHFIENKLMVNARLVSVKSISDEQIIKIKNFVIRALVFPVTLLTLALTEVYTHKAGKKFQFIGHLSYSSYLLHFPLQLCFLIFVRSLNLNTSFFNSGFTLLMFFLVLIFMCFLSFKYIELPMQSFLRKRFLVKKPV